MKRLFFVILLSCSVISVSLNARSSQWESIEMTRLSILSFYKKYLSESSSIRELDSLARTFLTSDMYDKLDRMNRLADGDQLIRAQDTTPYASKSLRCRHLKDDWYEVSWRYFQKDSLVRIPLKIKYVGSKPYICDLIPEMCGYGVGDYKLFLHKHKASKQLFHSFLARLRKIEDLSILAFGDTIANCPNLYYPSFKPYLSNVLPKYCHPEKYFWQGGGYMQKKDVVWVFLQACFEDTLSISKKWFEENTIQKYIVALYTKDGKLLSHQCVGQRSNMSYLIIDNMQDNSFDILQFELKRAEIQHGVPKLIYNVHRKRLLIGKNKKLYLNFIDSYVQAKPLSHHFSGSLLDFTGFMEDFNKSGIIN